MTLLIILIITQWKSRFINEGTFSNWTERRSSVCTLNSEFNKHPLHSPYIYDYYYLKFRMLSIMSKFGVKHQKNMYFWSWKLAFNRSNVLFGSIQWIILSNLYTWMIFVFIKIKVVIHFRFFNELLQNMYVRVCEPWVVSIKLSSVYVLLE